MRKLIVLTITATIAAGCGPKQSAHKPGIQTQSPYSSAEERVKREEASRRFDQWTIQEGSGRKWEP